MSIGHRLHPLPSNCTLPQYEQLNVFLCEIPHREFDDREAQKRPSQWVRRTAVPNKVYRSTLQKLRTWLLEEVSEKDQKTAESAPAISSSVPISLWDRDPRELAYHLLRAKIEHGDSDGLRSSIVLAQIADVPIIKIPGYQGIVPEEGMQWVYFAIYSGLVHSIKYARRQAQLKLHSLDLRDATLLVQGWIWSEKHVSVITVFPYVEGLPIDEPS
jgi:hypothetical protein